MPSSVESGESSFVNVGLRIVGAVLIFLGVRDMFTTLFHPAKQGTISDWIAASIWRIVRAVRPQSLSIAGPAAFVTIGGCWSASIILGFALIYLTEMPQGFKFDSGLDPQTWMGFWPAVQLSMSSLITLSSGAYPNQTWLGLAMDVESILGFALLTASVSWILSIYPVLEHRKSLAHEASLLHYSEFSGIRRLRDVSDSDVSQILLGLASQLTTSRNELIQFPITYYFHENEDKTSLAGVLPYLADLAEQNKNRQGAAALAATVLGGAVDDYLQWVAQTFLRRKFSVRAQILSALAEEHLRRPLRGAEVGSRAA